MSTLTKDFHFICVECRGIDCNLTDRCDECIDIDASVINNYLEHCKQLLAKQKYKCKCKDPLLSESVIDDQSIISDAPSSVDLPPVSLDVASVTSHISDFDDKFNPLTLGKGQI